MDDMVRYRSVTEECVGSLGSMIPAQLEEETGHASARLNEVLGGDIAGFVANRLQMSPRSCLWHWRQSRLTALRRRYTISKSAVSRL